MFHAFPAPDVRQNVGFLVRAIGREQHQQRFVHGLRRRVAEDFLRSAVPSGHNPIRVFADDGVVGGLDHRRQPSPRLIRPRAFRNVPQDHREHPSGRGLDLGYGGLHLKFFAIGAQGWQRPDFAHRALGHSRFSELVHVRGMRRPETLGHKAFDGLPQRLRR